MRSVSKYHNAFFLYSRYLEIGAPQCMLCVLKLETACGSELMLMWLSISFPVVCDNEFFTNDVQVVVGSRWLVPQLLDNSIADHFLCATSNPRASSHAWSSWAIFGAPRYLWQSPFGWDSRTPLHPLLQQFKILARKSSISEISIFGTWWPQIFNDILQARNMIANPFYNSQEARINQQILIPISIPKVQSVQSHWKQVIKLARKPISEI